MRLFMGPVVKMRNHLQTAPGTKKSQRHWRFWGMGGIEVSSEFEVVMKIYFGFRSQDPEENNTTISNNRKKPFHSGGYLGFVCLSSRYPSIFCSYHLAWEHGGFPMDVLGDYNQVVYPPPFAAHYDV